MGKEEKVSVSGIIYPSNRTITKYGHICLFENSSIMHQYFAPGDIITVEMLGQTFDVPYVVTFIDVDCYMPEILDMGSSGTYLAMNYGDIVSLSKVAHKVVHKDHSYTWVSFYDEIPFTLTLKEKGGYLEELKDRSVGIYSKKREDYPHLNDEGFANFRMLDKGEFAKGRIYRCASPIDNYFGRARIVDSLIRKYGITHVINLADSGESAIQHHLYDGSYYSQISAIELCMGIDFHYQEFKNNIYLSMEYIANNPGGIFAINCIEGKDRTGIFVALLECLLGYTLEEIEDDYMISYFNYYGVKKGEKKYDKIKVNIAIQLKYAFLTDDLSNLKELAKRYFLEEIRLPQNLLDKVIENLSH